jgi:hypothetical protein
MNHRLRIIGMTLALLLACHPVNGELLSLDLNPGSADRLLLRDTETGLEWLDVTQTVNQTYDQVRTGIWYEAGFRHATVDQLRTLFLHAGTPDDGDDPAVTYPDETNALITQLGATIVTRFRVSTYGFAGTDFFGNGVTLSTHPVGQRFDALLAKLDYLPAIFGNPPLGEAHFTQGQPFSDEASPNWGSFLVRSYAWPSQDTFLRGSGSSTLSLDVTVPTATIAKYRDSGSVSFSGGNAWREIGSWTALPAVASGNFVALKDLHVWLGLKNSDDQGTRFDLLAEVYKGDDLIASGLVRCIAGIVRSPNNAVEVAISFDDFAPTTFDGVTDVAKVRMLTRIGTNLDDTKCGGHNSAAGLRLYFDGINQASHFGDTIP